MPSSRQAPLAAHSPHPLGSVCRRFPRTRLEFPNPTTILIIFPPLDSSVAFRDIEHYQRHSSGRDDMGFWPRPGILPYNRIEFVTDSRWAGHPLSRVPWGIEAEEGHTLTQPADLLKNPLVLEFLGLAEKPGYSETDLETAIHDWGARG